MVSMQPLLEDIEDDSSDSSMEEYHNFLRNANDNSGIVGVTNMSFETGNDNSMQMA